MARCRFLPNLLRPYRYVARTVILPASLVNENENGLEVQREIAYGLFAFVLDYSYRISINFVLDILT